MLMPLQSNHHWLSTNLYKFAEGCVACHGLGQDTVVALKTAVGFSQRAFTFIHAAYALLLLQSDSGATKLLIVIVMWHQHFCNQLHRYHMYTNLPVSSAFNNDIIHTIT